MAKEWEGQTSATLVQRILTAWVGAVVQRPRTVLVFIGLAVLGCIVFAACRLSLLTQRDDLVNPRKDYQRRWIRHQQEFGRDDDIVVVVEGADPDRIKASIEEIAAGLRRHPILFDRLFYKVDLSHLKSRALFYASTKELREIEHYLEKMHWLVGRPVLPTIKWRFLNLDLLFSEARRRLTSDTDRPLSEDNIAFLRQLDRIVASASRFLDSREEYSNPWFSLSDTDDPREDHLHAPQYFFSDDGKLAFLLVRPKLDASRLTSADAPLTTLRRMLEDVRKRYSDLRFGLTGLPVLENDEMAASRRDTMLASGLAFFGVALLYLLVYRGIRYPLLTLSTLLIGMLLTLGWLTLTVGHLNILSATFAVMLIGLGDYGVLWITRYDEERRRQSVFDAVEATTRHIGPSILTAAITTSAAFFAALLVDFRAVTELGWIAGSGVLFCAVACFTFLPAVVTLVDREDARSAVSGTVAPERPFLNTPVRYPRTTLAVAALAIAVAASFLVRVRYDHNLLNLQARDLESVRWQHELLRRAQGVGWHALCVAETREKALELKAKLETLPCVGQVAEIASLIPEDQREKQQIIARIHHQLRDVPTAEALAERGLPSAGRLRRRVDELLPLLSETIPNRLRGSLHSHLTRFRKALDAVPETQAGPRLREFERRMVQDLADNLRNLREVSQPTPITIDDIPKELRERHIGKNGRWLLRVFGQESLWEFDALEKFVTAVRRVDPDVTGKPITTYEGLRAMQQGFVWACVYAVIAMIVILSLDFGKIKHVLLALAPLAASMAVTLGILGAFGIPLNPANVIALPLILGVGVDNGIHVLHDHLSGRDGRRLGLTASTGRGILVAALTTILSFGTLMISHHQGLAGLGLLLTIGVSCSLLSALVVLPALIRVVLKDRSRASAPETTRTRTGEQLACNPASRQMGVS